MIGASIGRPIFGRINLSPLFQDGALAAAGASTPAFVGESTHDGVLSAAGTSTPAFIGASTHDGIWSAAGVSTVSWTGEVVAEGAFTISGTSTVTWTGQAVADGVFSAAGTAPVTFYSAYRLLDDDNAPSATVTGVQTATDATLIRDPHTWP